MLPGLLVLPIIGAIGDAWGIRGGMLIMLPIFVVGGLIIASAGNVINEDINAGVATTAAHGRRSPTSASRAR